MAEDLSVIVETYSWNRLKKEEEDKSILRESYWLKSRQRRFSRTIILL